MNWDELVGRLQACSASVSLSLNFLLIFLIIKRSPEQLGSYRYLMIYTALFEMFYSIVDVIVSPIIYSKGVMFFVISDTKESDFSKGSLLLSICLWCSCFGTFMTLFCIQFIYRYFVIIGSNKIKSFNDYRIVFWIITPILLGTAWGGVVYFFMGPKADTDSVIRDLVLSDLDLIIEDINYIGSRCHKTINDGVKIEIDFLIGVSFMMIIVISSLSCITVLKVKTYMTIRTTLSTSTTSKKHNRLQSQTFYALVTQTLIPVILMHFPCSMIQVAIILDIDLGHSSRIVSITVTMFPALDPLPVMLIIQNYREALLGVVSSSVRIFDIRRKRSK